MDIINNSKQDNDTPNKEEEPEKERRRLEHENRELTDLNTCKACLSARSNVCFMPCGHIWCCEKCSKLIRNCLICRAFIKQVIHIKN